MLRERVQGQSLVSSRVAVVEVGKAVARANPTADPQPMLARIALVELDAELAMVAASTGAPALRSLDAIHLASAALLERDLARFCTYDLRLAAAAEATGMVVVAPA